MLNCVVDDRYDDALKEAKEVDEFIKHGNFSEDQLAYQKPFLGVPFSTKNCIAVKGTHINFFLHNYYHKIQLKRLHCFICDIQIFVVI